MKLFHIAVPKGLTKYNFTFPVSQMKSLTLHSAGNFLASRPFRVLVSFPSICWTAAKMESKALVWEACKYRKINE